MVHDLATVAPALPPLGEVPGPPVTPVVGRLDSECHHLLVRLPSPIVDLELKVGLVSSQGARVPEEGRGRAEGRAEQCQNNSNKDSAVAAFEDQRYAKSPELW